MVAPAIDSYDVGETLDAVESVWLATVEGNCEIFRLAAHYADVCNGDGLPRSRSVIPGTERSVQLGGAGTPRVSEFAAAEFGARMRLGTVGAKHLIADALDARHRLPRLWARMCAGEVRVAWVRRVAARTRELTVEAAALVDAEVVEVADGRLPWSRFCDVLEGRIVAADPEAAARREEDERQRVFAKSNRFSTNGVKGFYLRAPVALIVRFDATVAYLAEALKALGGTDDEDHRRVKACAILANPTQAVELLAAFAAHRSRQPDDDSLPVDQPETDEPAVPVTVPHAFRPGELPAWLRRATDPGARWFLDWPRLLPPVDLFLHVAKETLDAGAAGVVRWEDEEPISLQYVRDMIAPFHQVRVHPVIDLAGQEPVDSYEVPLRHRRAVHLRTPADCFPFSSNTTDGLDIDHTEAFERADDGTPAAPGQSRLGNYSPLGRFHHRVKTHARWTVKQPFEGIYVWQDPHGHFYVVDHTGSRKLTPPGPRTPRPRGDGHPIDIELIETDFDVVLDEDFTLHAA